jgi:hypothetical protein
MYTNFNAQVEFDLTIFAEVPDFALVVVGNHLARKENGKLFEVKLSDEEDDPRWRRWYETGTELVCTPDTPCIVVQEEV